MMAGSMTKKNQFGNKRLSKAVSKLRVTYQDLLGSLTGVESGSKRRLDSIQEVTESQFEDRQAIISTGMESGYSASDERNTNKFKGVWNKLFSEHMDSSKHQLVHNFDHLFYTPEVNKFINSIKNKNYHSVEQLQTEFVDKINQLYNGYDSATPYFIRKTASYIVVRCCVKRCRFQLWFTEEDYQGKKVIRLFRKIY